MFLFFNFYGVLVSERRSVCTVRNIQWSSHCRTDLSLFRYKAETLLACSLLSKCNNFLTAFTATYRAVNPLHTAKTLKMTNAPTRPELGCRLVCEFLSRGRERCTETLWLVSWKDGKASGVWSDVYVSYYSNSNIRFVKKEWRSIFT